MPSREWSPTRCRWSRRRPGPPHRPTSIRHSSRGRKRCPVAGTPRRCWAAAPDCDCVTSTARACAHLLLYRADAPWERLNVADTVKVPWQAYLGAGHPLLSDQGRVLATLVADGSGRHDALCGTTSLASNTAKYGDGSLHSASPAGRELLHRGGGEARTRAARPAAVAVVLPRGAGGGGRGAEQHRVRRRGHRGRSPDPPAGDRADRQHGAPARTRRRRTTRPRSKCSPGPAPTWPTLVNAEPEYQRALLEHRRRLGCSAAPGTGAGMTTTIETAPLVPGTVILDEEVGARGPWSAVVVAGDVLTIVDLYGNQAVDTLIYAADDHSQRYSAAATVSAQRNLFLTTGSVLRSRRSDAADDASSPTRSATTTPSAAPARRSRTPCGTATTPSTSTPASRTSSPKDPSGDRQAGPGRRTSTSS